MIFGQGTHQYTVEENWWTLPEGWEFRLGSRCRR